MSGYMEIHGSQDLLPAFSANPPGVLVLRRHWDGNETWLTITRADPEVHFSDELLTEFANGGDHDGMYPDVELDQTPDHHDGQECPDKPICFTDCVVRIEGRDRTVIYRIGEYLPRMNSWMASWPD